MAINKPKGDNSRKGAVKNRTQVFNPKIEKYVKRNKDTGKFMNVKSDNKKFKGVTTEKKIQLCKMTGKKKDLMLRI